MVGNDDGHNAEIDQIEEGKDKPGDEGGVGHAGRQTGVCLCEPNTAQYGPHPHEGVEDEEVEDGDQQHEFAP